MSLISHLLSNSLRNFPNEFSVGSLRKIIPNTIRRQVTIKKCVHKGILCIIMHKVPIPHPLECVTYTWNWTSPDENSPLQRF